jgi:uncharacterized LabA/DUF88 family protein
LSMPNTSRDAADFAPGLAAPPRPRVFAYFDGQNLFNAAKRAFGEDKVRYDPLQLARLVCSREDWNLLKVFFYTGVPPYQKSRFLNIFWELKIHSMKRRGINCHTRELMYRRRDVTLDDGSEHQVSVAEEKGIDVRIAVDVVKHAYSRSYDIGLIFSQDNDLMPAVDHVRELAKEGGWPVKFATAFPVGPTSDRWGIRNTDWKEIDRAEYESCLDPWDYEPSVRKTLAAMARQGR